MIMYDNKRGMSKCLFIDGDWTCDDCDMRLRGMCSEGFYKKHGYFKEESE